MTRSPTLYGNHNISVTDLVGTAANVPGFLPAGTPEDVDCPGEDTVDCAGVCGGSAAADCLGICNGPHISDGSGGCCLAGEIDCAGVCFGTSEIGAAGGCCPPGDLDECGVCGGDGTGAIGCPANCGDIGSCECDVCNCPAPFFGGECTCIETVANFDGFFYSFQVTNTAPWHALRRLELRLWASLMCVVT